MNYRPLIYISLCLINLGCAAASIYMSKVYTVAPIYPVTIEELDYTERDLGLKTDAILKGVDKKNLKKQLRSYDKSAQDKTCFTSSDAYQFWINLALVLSLCCSVIAFVLDIWDTWYHVTREVALYAFYNTVKLLQSLNIFITLLLLSIFNNKGGDNRIIEYNYNVPILVQTSPAGDKMYDIGPEVVYYTLKDNNSYCVPKMWDQNVYLIKTCTIIWAIISLLNVISFATTLIDFTYVETNLETQVYKIKSTEESPAHDLPTSDVTSVNTNALSKRLADIENQKRQKSSYVMKTMSTI